MKTPVVPASKRLSPEALLRNLAIAALQSSSWDQRTAIHELRDRILKDREIRDYILKFCITETVQASVTLAMKAQRDRERSVLGKQLTSVERLDATLLLSEHLRQSDKALGEAVRPELSAERTWETQQANRHIHRVKWFGAIMQRLPDAVTPVSSVLSETDVRTLWEKTELSAKAESRAA